MAEDILLFCAFLVRIFVCSPGEKYSYLDHFMCPVRDPIFPEKEQNINTYDSVRIRILLSVKTDFAKPAEKYIR